MASTSVPQALILDADGVVVTPPQLYSSVRASQLGLEPSAFLPFFNGPFKQALTGRADLEELIDAHNDLWQWDRSFTDLIQDWCEAENHPNTELLELVRRLRDDGIPVYLGTNQERHRTAYLHNKMFKGVFNDIIASYAVGYLKDSPEYWQAALNRVQADRPRITATEIAYFDDHAKYVNTAAGTGINAHVYKSIDDVTSLFETKH